MVRLKDVKGIVHPNMKIVKLSDSLSAQNLTRGLDHNRGHGGQLSSFFLFYFSAFF